ncbi:hypothetical protein T4B_6336 [Trichinella pseudospiralis]|uniref:Uncharacterized protein n=1 Tax=Trichinella pseudospiralis TaxID=6337 RepID=A0A0V1EW78_TRIPS|nr:hypothetical protein T4A_11636 [Trichinella pseudospiralis]KRZ29904.1 hypothetical protein T4B_6336 [Trichinella pseudospiralis]KRZ44438.1 hypothetical protein T4C_4309 [Trichinella pseudospiralis]
MTCQRTEYSKSNQVLLTNKFFNFKLKFSVDKNYVMFLRFFTTEFDLNTTVIRYDELKSHSTAITMQQQMENKDIQSVL